MNLAEEFAEGGAAMYPIALLGCLGVLVGFGGLVLGLTMAKQRTAMVAAGLMAFGLLAPMMGGLGYWMGLSSVEQALAHVSPEDVATIRAAGTAEAMVNLQYGLGAGLLPFCLGLTLLGVGLSRLRPAPVSPPATGV